MTSTDFNYTGQRLDDSGLLYYNARYYDPVVGRFVSPDSIVPGVESGKGGAAASVGAYQNHKLTVDFHEPSFAASVREENKLILDKGFWFQLSSDDKSKTDPSGPSNPQALNRYSYVLNNPLRYTDPTGHMLIQLIDGGRLRIGLSAGDVVGMAADLATGAVVRKAAIKRLRELLSNKLRKAVPGWSEGIIDFVVDRILGLLERVSVAWAFDELVMAKKHVEIWIPIGAPWQMKAFLADGTQPPDNFRDVPNPYQRDAENAYACKQLGNHPGCPGYRRKAPDVDLGRDRILCGRDRDGMPVYCGIPGR